MDIHIEDIIQDFENEATKKPVNYKRSQLNRLIQAMVNERMCPELLVYEHELMEEMLVSIRTQIEFIELNSVELQTTAKDIKLQLLIIESELGRINYVIRQYLRVRLHKIDQYNLYITTNESEIKKLSASELGYMSEHFTLLTELYNNEFLKRFPQSLQLLDDNTGGVEMIERPDLDQPVFVKVVTDQQRNIYVGGEEIDLERDGIYVVRYSSVRGLVLSGEVLLI